MRNDLSSSESSGMIQAGVPHASDDIRSGESIEVLQDVLQPAVSLSLWQRLPDLDLAAWLSQRLQSRSAVECYGTADAIDVPALVDRALCSPGSIPGSHDAEPRERFIADVQQLVRLFCALRPEGKQHVLHVKLSMVDKADCPVLHTDWVTLRLICTYLGAGTEYAAAHAVTRSALCRPLGSHAETNAAILRDPQGLRRMPPFAVGVMKGNGYPGHAGRGLVHRSPPTGSGRRIKLIIDSTLPPEGHEV